MDGTTGPSSDVTAMESENDEISKVQRDKDDPTTSASSSRGAYSTSHPEYRGQGSIRARSASPLPITASSSSSSSSLLSSSPPQPGCGCVAATVLEPDEITVIITPTTGGQFGLIVDRTDTVENLKKIISKRLKVAKERICLLHRESQLREGTLDENRLQDGSRLTLLPSVETGLLAQRPEQSVMQALESLNDSQVNDFLSGKAPLNLTMRLGDHMMLIQLQLSTVTPASPTTNQTNNNTTGLTIGGNSSNGSSLSTSHVSTSLRSRRSTVAPTSPTTNQTNNNTTGLTIGGNSSNGSGLSTSHVWTPLRSRRSKVASTSPTNNQTNNNTTGLTIGGNSSNGSSLSTSHVSTSLRSRRSTVASTSPTSNQSDNNTTGLTIGGNSSNGSSLSTSHVSPLLQSRRSTVASTSPTSNQSNNNTTGLTIGGNSSNGSSLSTSHISPLLQSRRSRLLAALSTYSSSRKLLVARTTSLVNRLIATMYDNARHQAATTGSSSTPSYSSIRPPHSSFCTIQSQPSRTSSNLDSVSPNCSYCLPFLRYGHNHHHNHYHCHHHQHHHHHLCRRHQRHHHHHCHHHQHHSRNKPIASSSTTPQSSSTSSSSVDHLLQQSTSSDRECADSSSYEITPSRKKLCTAHHHSQHQSADSSRSIAIDGDSSPQSPTSSSLAEQNSKAATLDTRALAEASRNLTQKLKLLSSEENAGRTQGAIIESMHHHGKGVYSGTFSGTLNPALQDRHGRPKRDISTIIHILNDLLCATPAATADHYRHHHRHSDGRQQSSTSPSSTGTTTTVNGASTPLGCHESSTPGYSTEELSKENEATKGKMRRLRLVMEQRRAKRNARR